MVKKQEVITKNAFELFKTLWRSGKFTGWEYGKAFSKHFKLSKTHSKEFVTELESLNFEESQAFIGKHFQFH